MERIGKRGGAKTRQAMLLASTALCAVAVGLPARAQNIDPSTTPTGGVVVGGSSTIIQAPGATTINQGSERTAINWQSFNVGSNAQVTFNQPNAQAIALNRVTGGNLSIINGRIDANGQIVLVNQSGVVFAKGSQVNAENIVVSTSDISPGNFMAGKMLFDGAPNPGAAIINEGHLTAKQAGLVGLVAPQVSNSGVITAQLGTVILAGARAFTLDLYGDRLISLDVTQAVRGIDVGGKIIPALVTNSGLIIADGGQITLTAQDADALVTALISAGGTIQADSLGGRTGRISLQGVGGDIAIAGNLLARGLTPGAKGGAIEVVDSGTVAVASAAVLDASGVAGGGDIAVGTDIARAVQGAADVSAPKAAVVTVAAGAVLRADATGGGDGGHVVLLSRRATDFQGGVSVQGGPTGGNGGAAEISSDGVISLGGTVIATAINGQAGEILLDPSILYVGGQQGTADLGHGATTFGNFGATGVSNISPAQLDLLTGRVTLEAASLISVVSAVDMQLATALSLISLGDISISAAITVNGSLVMDASNSLSIDAPLDAKNIMLSSGASGTSIDAPVTAGTLISLAGLGPIDEGSFVTNGTIPTTLTGALTAPTLVGVGTIGGDVLLTNNNAIGTLGGITLTAGGNLELFNTVALNAAGTVHTGTLLIDATSLAIAGALTATTSAELDTSSGSSESGGIDTPRLGGNLEGTNELTGSNTIGILSALGADTFALDDSVPLTIQTYLDGTALTISAPSISIDGGINGTALALESSGTISETGDGIVNVSTLTSGGTTIGGDVQLGENGNSVATLAGFTLAAGHTLSLLDSGLLTVDGPVVAPVATLTADLIEIPGSITSTVLALQSDGVTGAGNVTAATLTSGGGTIGGSVSLTGAGNSISNLGDLILDGNLFLADSTGLTVLGTVAAPNGEINMSGTTLAEAAGGSVRAATLAGDFTGGATLGRSNNFGALAGFTAASALLADTEALNLEGQLNVSGGVVLNDSGGGIAEQAGGTVTAGAFGGSIAGDLSLTNVNTIGSLNALTLAPAGALLFDDAATLGIGDVTASNAEILAPSINITGTLAVADELAFSSTGDITETAGVIDAGTLISFNPNQQEFSNSDIGGDVFLTGANSVSVLGPFTTAGTFDLNDLISLDIQDELSGADVTLAAPAIGLNGEIVAGTTQTPGTLAIATNSFGIDPFIINGDTFNSVIYVPSGTIAIAPFTDGKDIDIGGGDAGDLDILPTLIGSFDTFRAPAELIIGQADGHQAGAETIDNSTTIGIGELDLDPSGAITDHGTLDADTLAFSGGGFNQSAGGLLEAAELLGDGGAITGAVALGNTTNQIGELGSVSVTGADFTLASEFDLFTPGPVVADDVVLESSRGLELAGGITAAAGGTIDLVADTIDLFSGASLQAVDGRVAVAPYDDIDVDFGGYNGGLHIDGGLGGDVNARVLQIGSADGFTGGVLNIDGPLTITPPTLALDGAAIDFTDTLTEPGLVTFDSAGEVAETLPVEGGGLGAINAGTVTGAGGTIVLGGANSIAVLGSLISGTNITVNNAIALDIAGLLDAPGTLKLSDSGGGVSETAGLIDAGTLSVIAPAGAVLLGNANSVNVVGTLQAGGRILFNDLSDLVIAGLIGTPGEASLEDAGGISENGRIAAGTLDSGGTTIGGDVILNGANTIAGLGGFTVAGAHALALRDTGGLNVTGPVTAGSATLSATSLTFTGDLDIANELALVSASGISETTGAITAGTLDSGGATEGGGVALNNGNTIGTLGGFAAGGGLILNDLTPLRIAGNVSLGGVLALLDSGAITQTGGGIQASGLTSDGGTIGGAVALLQPGNVIAALGVVEAPAGFALADNGPLALNGDIFTGTSTLDLAVGNGGIFQNAGVITAGTVDAAATDISLADANAINRLGAVNTGNLLAHGVAGLSGPLVASGDATITSPGNFLAAGPARVAGNLLIGANGNINQPANTGPVTAGSATYDAAGAIDLAGTTDIGGVLDLIATGNIIHNAGLLNAGTLTGSAGTLASFTGPTNVQTLGSFLMQDSLFVLDNDSALVIAGPVKASAMSISAVGLMTLQGTPDGGLFFTGGIAPKDTTKPRPQDSVLTVTSAGRAPPRLVQTGVFYINSGPNAKALLAGKGSAATIFINTTPNGAINFAPAPPTTAGLDGPTVDVVIAAGTGTVTGNVNLKQVVIVSAGKVDLTGFLNSVGGPSGAGNGVVTPFPDPNFQFNACPIGSVNCTILPVESLPSPDPLQNFDIEQHKKRKLDHNVQLPGIATRDF